MPDVFDLMTHPKVLKCFGGNVTDSVFGVTHISFPSMLRAAQWAELWKENKGGEERLFVRNALSPFDRAAISVTE
jgi:hypothetical protein